MFKKKRLLIVVVSFVVLLLALLIYSPTLRNDKASNQINAKVKLVDVDQVVENPEKFSGVINIEGAVKEISDKSDNLNFFTLGCEDDDDANIPVLYKGELPKEESNIIVSGEIKKDVDGKLFFDAKEIKYK